jgi:hypothetical protein
MEEEYQARLDEVQARADGLREFGRQFEVRLPDDALLTRLMTLAGADVRLEHFGLVINYIILGTHRAEAIKYAHELPHRKIAQYARGLATLLKTSNTLHLTFLMGRTPNIEYFAEALDELNYRCRMVGGLVKGRRVARDINGTRHQFVRMLLENAEQAGGRLTLDRRNEAGSLVESIELLKPFLPKEVSGKLSFSTVRRIYEAGSKQKKIAPKKAQSERTSNLMRCFIYGSPTKVTRNDQVATS